MDAVLEDALKSVQPSSATGLEQRKSDYWQTLGTAGDPPAVNTVRTVSMDEVDQVTRECMESKGFPSTVDRYGQVAIPFQAEQEEAMNLASYECFAMYPLDEKYFEPFTLEQLRMLYDWNIKEVSACLHEEGLTPSPAPTFESFVERYARTGVEYWTAYEGVDVGLVKCEWEPPDEELYGGNSR